MAQKLLVYQSQWTTERRRPDRLEWLLEQPLTMIRDTGFDGVGVRVIDPGYAREVTGFLRANAMTWQALCHHRRGWLRAVRSLAAVADHDAHGPAALGEGFQRAF